ncbi:MAG TPA: polysaccharide biosynthesis tyrosine autokinase [Thermoguttaceae bacterium]|nr:polysaccharide biosynthesis tyrosine autokinase [Thermoguttaceae bacterium]
MSEKNATSSNGTPFQAASNGSITVLDSRSYAAQGANGSGFGGQSGQGFTLSFVLNALRQWWKLAVPIGLLLGAAAGGSIYWLFEPVYQAEAWLQILGPQQLVFPAEGDSRVFVETQVQTIKSPLVLGPVVSKPEIAEMEEVKREEWPIEWLRKKVKVQALGGSELYTISFEGTNAADSKEIVEEVVNSYLNLQAQEDAERTQRVIELLEDERERQFAKVDQSRGIVRELSLQATGRDPFGQRPEQTISAVEHPLQELRRQLTTAEAERGLLEAKIKDSEKVVGDQQIEVADAMVEKEISEHPEVQGLKLALSGNRARLRGYETKLADGEKDPIYQSLSTRIDEDEKRLEEIRNKLRPEVAEDIRGALDGQRKEELARMQDQLRSYTLLEEFYKEKYKEELESVQRFTGETFELKSKQTDLSLEEQVFELIALRVTKLRTEQRAPARVTLRQQAETPKKPVEVVPYKQILLGSLAGLCLPFGLAVLWERVVRRVSDARQLGQQSQLPVVGEIARLPVRTSVFPRSSSQRMGQDLRVFEESVDSLRTCLALSEPLRDVKVLAVTSAANNEGKTSVAVQLAVSSARASGEMALLIDGDMRSPDVHKVLETRLGPGLAEVLNGECTLEEAIITDWSSRVHILPAGKLRGSPHKLLGNGALKSLLETVRSSYRHVVIDTPPILAAGEALVFARAADASLICAMRDVSRMDQINTAHDRLKGAGGNPVGVVLNGVPTKQYAYRYGTYDYHRA